MNHFVLPSPDILVGTESRRIYRFSRRKKKRKRIKNVDDSFIMMSKPSNGEPRAASSRFWFAVHEFSLIRLRSTYAKGSSLVFRVHRMFSEQSERRNARQHSLISFFGTRSPPKTAASRLCKPPKRLLLRKAFLSVYPIDFQYTNTFRAPARALSLAPSLRRSPSLVRQSTKHCSLRLIAVYRY